MPRALKIQLSARKPLIKQRPPMQRRKLTEFAGAAEAEDSTVVAAAGVAEDFVRLQLQFNRRDRSPLRSRAQNPFINLLFRAPSRSVQPPRQEPAPISRPEPIYQPPVSRPEPISQPPKQEPAPISRPNPVIRPNPVVHGNPVVRPNPGEQPRPGQVAQPRPGMVNDRGGNIVSQEHQTRIQATQTKIVVVQKNVHVTEVVTNINRTYVRNVTVIRNNYGPRYSGYFQGNYAFRDRWSNWGCGEYGFRGGFYWGFRPYYAIDNYFYNPLFAFFYVVDVALLDAEYYNAWGPDYYAAYYSPNPYRYAGVFFPTQEFVDLNLGMAAYDVNVQVAYRNALTSINATLEQQLNLQLGPNSLTINHYQMLPGEAGAVIEGFVTTGSEELPFKALISLSDPSLTEVYIPTVDSIDDLNNLNGNIVSLGGILE